jgi:hypothetical protein
VSESPYLLLTRGEAILLACVIPAPFFYQAVAALITSLPETGGRLLWVATALVALGLILRGRRRARQHHAKNLEAAQNFRRAIDKARRR